MHYIKMINNFNDGKKTVVFPTNAVSFISYTDKEIIISFNNKESITITDDSGEAVKNTAEKIEEAFKQA